MPTPSPPWYQFSLRSLFLLTLFVAVLCSIGVCTNWFFSVVLAILTLGGIAGRIVARSGVGFVPGVLCGTLLALITVPLAALFSLHVLVFVRPPQWLLAVFWLVAALISVVVGGVLGGLIARNPPRK